MDTTNRFQVLKPMNLNNLNTVPTMRNKEPLPKKYLPPITIKGIKYDQIKTIISTLKIQKMRLKLTSFGQRIECEEKSEHIALITYLRENSYEFYSYIRWKKIGIFVLHSQACHHHSSQMK